jgi:hypothetical protein
MTCLKLDPVTWDLVVENGSFAEVDGIEEIRQTCRLRLMRFRGEVPRNADAGMPYLEEIFAKGTSPQRLEFIYRQEILGTPGIIEITEGPDLEFNEETRHLSISFRAATDFGDLVERGFNLGRAA